MAPDFFTRVDGLSLVPGNKTAGFVGVVSTEALRILREIPVGNDEVVALLTRMRERLLNAKLIPKRALNGSGVSLLAGSACPRFFVTDPTFGGSIGADPDDLDRLDKPEAFDYIGPTTDYTPHNVDTPAQALALLVMFETWAEWAHGKLYVHAQSTATPGGI
jgi:hypothetical protein